MNQEIARKFYKIGFAIFNEETREEVESFNEIEAGNYYAIVGENQTEDIKQEVKKIVKNSNYKIKTTLENVVNQITSHFIACIENNVDDALSNCNSIPDSVKLFFTEYDLEDLSEYDCEI